MYNNKTLTFLQGAFRVLSLYTSTGPHSYMAHSATVICLPSTEALAKCLTTIQAAIATAMSFSLCYIHRVGCRGSRSQTMVICTHIQTNSHKEHTRCLASRSMQVLFSQILSLVRTHPLDKFIKTHRA